MSVSLLAIWSGQCSSGSEPARPGSARRRAGATAPDVHGLGRVAVSEAASSDVTPDDGRESQRGRARVLVVDDDHSIRALVTRVVKRAGSDAFEAVDGQDAIEKLAAERFDCIVLDLMMPRLDGFGVVDYLIENQPRLVEKTIVMTAFPKAAARERLHHLCTIVSKPFEVSELLVLLQNCVSR